MRRTWSHTGARPLVRRLATVRMDLDAEIVDQAFRRIEPMTSACSWAWVNLY
jgi:hypothetical protein